MCTIDKFFQNVLRAFAREVGQYASYRLKVEEDDVLTQVVDELIASTEEPGKENLLKWLRDYSIDLVEQGRNWRFNRDLKEMASQFLKESFMLQCRQLGQDGTGGAILGDKERLRTFLHKISGMIAGFENDALRIAGSIKEMMDRHGVTYAGLKAGQKQPMLVFRDWLAGKYTAPDEDLLRESVTRFPGDQTALSALVAEGAALYNDRSLDYFSARAIRGNLYLMGIYRELQDTLNAFLRENNVVILPLANDTLSRIIGNDDAPFVYEKIGNRYDHLMLDEAQDTSLMQWNNFRPLFRNSQASGGRNLVVGDVKQSIYRWRGSDWRLMSEKIRQDLDVGAFVPCSLRDNWRSDRAINFNNALFSAVGSIIARDTTRTVPTREVQRIYPDESDSLNTCVQLISPERENVRQGYVRVTFLPKAKDSGQTWQEEALQRMIEDIRSLEKEGYALKDITVLVRTNKQGAMVADALIDAGISVLTEDSLLIGSSPCISRLMAVLSLRVKPEDPVSGLLARPYKHLLSELKPGSLYETCEQLLGSGCFSQSKEDLPYILAFLDAVLSYQEKYSRKTKHCHAENQ